MKRMYFKLFILAFTVSSLSVSCRKNQDKNDAAEIAQQSSLAQKTMNSLGVLANEAINESFVTFAASCATITYDTLTTAKTITVDFGTSDCLCADGKNRRGKVNISNNGAFNGLGSANKTTISTNGYYVSDNLIEATRVVTKLNATETNWASSAVITLPTDRGVFSWKGEFVSKYISGDNTPYANDDEYEVSGEASGVNTKEVEYTIVTVDPLQVQTGCRWVKGGSVSITADNMKEEATVEYGDGSCDNIALLKYKNKEKVISL